MITSITTRSGAVYEIDFDTAKIRRTGADGLTVRATGEWMRYLMVMWRDEGRLVILWPEETTPLMDGSPYDAHPFTMTSGVVKVDGFSCRLCRSQAEGDVGPSHKGSPLCESGSVASGGNHTHCTCNTCF